MAYTTETKVENLLGIDITGAGSTALIDVIAAVKAWIDRYTGKTFEGVSETRYYDGNNQKDLLIDSFTGSPTVTILLSDGTTDQLLTEGQASDFITAPYNSTEKNRLILTGNGWYGTFPCWIHRVKVTAVFGQSVSVPADIQYIATRLTGELFQGNKEGLLKSVTLGDYSATFDNVNEIADALNVTGTLDLYRDIDV